MQRLLVSAAHKSSGKTTLSTGLVAALVDGGLAVQPFKKGPDYIDPMWLSLAAGRPCINLDPYLQDPPQLVRSFEQALPGADLALVEGNKGLYDGLALDGSNCNAALAKSLGLPVLLVIDARGMTRGIAPLILGYQAFDPAVHIGGVILNRVGGSRHEAKLRAVIEHYTPVPVLGAVADDPRLALTERHLGLMPCAEVHDARAAVQGLGRIIGAQVDLDRVRALAASAGPWPAATDPPQRGPQRAGLCSVRIGIARDRPSASTTRTIWWHCRTPVPNWCPSIRCTTSTCRPWTVSSSVGAFLKPAWTNCRPTSLCALRCAMPSKADCPPMPSAVA
jgi:cobyrinic acid a,c-diamide synthase